ncbi:Plakophilin-4 [Sparganum proliferum]
MSSQANLPNGTHSSLSYLNACPERYDAGEMNAFNDLEGGDIYHDSEDTTAGLVTEMILISPPPSPSGLSAIPSSHVSRSIRTSVKPETEEEIPAPEPQEKHETIPDDELRRLIACLTNSYPVISRNAAAYFHHVTYRNPRLKEKLADLDGIQNLSDLVLSSDAETRRHSIGALRNLSYQPSPLVVYKLQKASVIANLTTVLDEARVDTSPGNATYRKRLEDAITATLCNLSTREDFRDEIIKNTIPVLMNAIILPLSGLPQQRRESDVFSDEPSTKSAPEASALIFATGTVRNVLTETADCRHRLRETPGLVAALIYLCKCLAHAGEFDSRVLENCVCALRNLSFALQEVRDPAYLTRREAGFYQAATSVPDEKRLDFHRKPKAGLVLDTTKDAADQRLQDQPSYLEIPPSVLSLFHGSQLLWQPEVVLVYLSVLRGCKNPCIVEAVTGAIQNLTACDWRPSIEIRRRFREERGIPLLIELLQSEEDCVVKTTVTALRNLAVDARNRDEISLHGIPALIARLPVLQNSSSSAVATVAATRSVTLNTAASILATLFALIKDKVEHATFFVDCGGVPPCMAIANTGLYTDPLSPVPTERDKTVRFARHILRLLWHIPELQKRFQSAGWRAANFCVLEKPLMPRIPCGSSAAAAKAAQTLRPSQIVVGPPEAQPERRQRPLSAVSAPPQLSGSSPAEKLSLPRPTSPFLSSVRSGLSERKIEYPSQNLLPVPAPRALRMSHRSFSATCDLSAHPLSSRSEQSPPPRQRKIERYRPEDHDTVALLLQNHLEPPQILNPASSPLRKISGNSSRLPDIVVRCPSSPDASSVYSSTASMVGRNYRSAAPPVSTHRL